MRQGPVFYDPEGRRRRVVNSSTRILGLLVSIFGTLFILSLFAVPSFSQSAIGQDKRKRHPFIPTSKPGVPSGIVTGKLRADLMREIAREKNAKAPVKETAQRIIGFFDPDLDTGMDSLRANITNMSDLIPQWIRLTADGGGIDLRDFDPDVYPKNREVLQLCDTNHVAVLPLLRNWSGDGPNGQGFDPDRVHKLVTNPSIWPQLATTLRNWLSSNHLAGLNVDFENLNDKDYKELPKFLAALRLAFQPAGLQLSVDLEAGRSPQIKGEIAAACDFVILMAYDYHDEGGDEGPIAPVGWTQEVISSTLTTVPKSKLVLGMGTYSYEWKHNVAGANTTTYEEALTDAAGYLPDTPPKEAIKLDQDTLNNYFEYQDDDDQNHVVWMQDAISTYNQWHLGRSYGLKGFSVWEVGQEDPSIWNFLDRGSTAYDGPKNDLEKVRFPYSVDNVGKGELLTVRDELKEGNRTINVDKDTGLITGSQYLTYPSPYVIKHSGYLQKKVVLTFDDGPDPTFTPQILDILKRENVKAAFFMIGSQAEQYPKIVRRVYDEGHEIGNHTFTHPNLGTVGDWRIELELDATQRSIQSIVGRSSILFRPPYNADRDPASPVEVFPIIKAARIGYITVGESIDPLDWDPIVEDPNTETKRPRTVDDIVNDTVSGVIAHDVPAASNREGGNCILLHDAGGDRSKTIQALPRIIEALKAKGYEFVSIADLAHSTRDKMMPEISPHDRLLIFLDKTIFTIIFTGAQILAICFLVAIGLGLLRVALIAPLAILYERRRKGALWDPNFQPPVSVLIAAFNEERVIARTIASVLKSQYPVSEIVVVDDGSSDATSDAVRASFADDPRVKLIVQENAGKAEALNQAMTASTSEILISVDADTQLKPDAIGALVRHFKDEKVGAVAGNVQVGNVTNVVTTWQSIEYVTSQNMDRRAYGLLNAITVVPGAIGAWRKKAIEEVGGHQSDTLAEDMDLTWRLREAGYRLETESDAYAYTEAPDTMGAFFKQRFRWAYGTLQCLFKHRKSLFKNGFFGWLALPSLWVFQIIFQAIAPLVDLQILISVIGFAYALFQRATGNNENSPVAHAVANLSQAGVLYAVFFLVEVVAGIIAYRMERKRIGVLWWLFLQRFAYRQVMYAVVYKSLVTAMKGARQGWGKLDRKASVNMGNG